MMRKVEKKFISNNIKMKCYRCQEKPSFQCACTSPDVLICKGHMDEHLARKVKHVILPIEDLGDCQLARKTLLEIQSKVMAKFAKKILQIKLQAAEAIMRLNKVSNQFEFEVSKRNSDAECFTRLIENLQGLEFIDSPMLNELESKFVKEVSYTNGVYRGTIVNGERHGKGKFIYNSGEVYAGGFKHDLQHREGIYNFNSGNIYIGDFLKGTKHGNGKLIFNDGRVDEGQFKNDMFEGFGERTFTNGDFYQGRFKNWELDGKGTLTKADGTVYIGEFKNDQFHGPIIESNPNGEYTKQQYENGILKSN